MGGIARTLLTTDPRSFTDRASTVALPTPTPNTRHRGATGKWTRSDTSARSLVIRTNRAAEPSHSAQASLDHADTEPERPAKH
jgi:hypothetical protein